VGSLAQAASYVVDDPPEFRLLETILWTPEGGFALYERHMMRLAESAACFGFICEIDEVRRVLSDAVQDLRGPAKVRVLLEEDGDVLCEAADLVPLQTPIRAELAPWPVDRADVFLYHKTTRRDVYDRARAARPQAGAVILWNRDGQITEATESNIVIVKDGAKVTPPVDAGLLPGTLRAELLRSGEIVERPISKADLMHAEEVWLINSVRGWTRVKLEIG
jgi:para-aminobenzoate synthetase/4-amino-4-deoxychorismate lyase